MKNIDIAILTLCGLMVTAGGCATYYKVTDPASGQNYYTTKVEDKAATGAIKFEDEKSGSTVTLQSSQVKEISKEEYTSALKKPAVPKTQAPSPAEAPAQK